MSIKVSQLFFELQNMYAVHGDDKLFQYNVTHIVLNGGGCNYTIKTFGFSFSEFCHIQVYDGEVRVEFDDTDIAHGLGVHEPYYFRELLKIIALSLRQVNKANHIQNAEKWLGIPLLTAMIQQGMIEETKSWKLKV